MKLEFIGRHELYQIYLVHLNNMDDFAEFIKKMHVGQRTICELKLNVDFIYCFDDSGDYLIEHIYTIEEYTKSILEDVCEIMNIYQKILKNETKTQ